MASLPLNCSRKNIGLKSYKSEFEVVALPFISYVALDKFFKTHKVLVFSSELYHTQSLQELDKKKICLKCLDSGGFSMFMVLL